MYIAKMSRAKKDEISVAENDKKFFHLLPFFLVIVGRSRNNFIPGLNHRGNVALKTEKL